MPKQPWCIATSAYTVMLLPVAFQDRTMSTWAGDAKIVSRTMVMLLQHQPQMPTGSGCAVVSIMVETQHA